MFSTKMEFQSLHLSLPFLFLEITLVSMHSRLLHQSLYLVHRIGIRDFQCVFIRLLSSMHQIRLTLKNWKSSSVWNWRFFPLTNFWLIVILPLFELNSSVLPSPSSNKYFNFSTYCSYRHYCRCHYKYNISVKSSLAIFRSPLFDYYAVCVNCVILFVPDEPMYTVSIQGMYSWPLDVSNTLNQMTISTVK